MLDSPLLLSASCKQDGEKNERSKEVGGRKEGGGREIKENKEQCFASSHLQTACGILTSHTLLGSL